MFNRETCTSDPTRALLLLLGGPGVGNNSDQLEEGILFAKSIYLLVRPAIIYPTGKQQ